MESLKCQLVKSEANSADDDQDIEQDFFKFRHGYVETTRIRALFKEIVNIMNSRL